MHFPRTALLSLLFDEEVQRENRGLNLDTLVCFVHSDETFSIPMPVCLYYNRNGIFYHKHKIYTLKETMFIYENQRCVAKIQYIPVCDTVYIGINSFDYATIPRPLKEDEKSAVLIHSAMGPKILEY